MMVALSGEAAEERFMGGVAKDPSGCWLWMRSRDASGYGRCCLLGERYAHRVAFILFIGPIFDGYHVCHACDNPPCCNPAHLRMASPTDNARERDEKGRGACGVRNPHAKLNDAAVMDAKARLGRHESVRSIARSFGVHPYAIYRIKHGLAWKHLLRVA